MHLRQNRFNRSKVECKEVLAAFFIQKTKRFNRSKVECKGLYSRKHKTDLQVSIDPKWNVKTLSLTIAVNCSIVSIDPKWNVK